MIFSIFFPLCQFISTLWNLQKRCSQNCLWPLRTAGDGPTLYRYNHLLHIIQPVSITCPASSQISYWKVFWNYVLVLLCCQTESAIVWRGSESEHVVWQIRYERFCWRTLEKVLPWCRERRLTKWRSLSVLTTLWPSFLIIFFAGSWPLSDFPEVKGQPRMEIWKTLASFMTLLSWFYIIYL